MYLRHTTRRKDGKVHTYWQLVRSVRVGRKVVQQTVAHLGELDAQGRTRAKALARAITGDRPQPDLVEPSEPDEAIPIQLKRIRLERGRRFGDVWLAWTLWRALRLDETLERLLPEGRDAVPWATIAAVLVVARLCEPSSELHIACAWLQRACSVAEVRGEGKGRGARGRGARGKGVDVVSPLNGSVSAPTC
jgi:hypothetical protein